MLPNQAPTPLSWPVKAVKTPAPLLPKPPPETPRMAGMPGRSPMPPTPTNRFFASAVPAPPASAPLSEAEAAAAGSEDRDDFPVETYRSFLAHVDVEKNGGMSGASMEGGG
ncbi:hypothetical protein ZWY2020_018291 [Hordeum vulgare]|nr:hypothetical protein ZWY2020_018291 [Hordeum vulgare]